MNEVVPSGLTREAISARLRLAHFKGRFCSGHLVCGHRDKVQVIGSPQLGCAYWEREPGSDDD